MTLTTDAESPPSDGGPPTYRVVVTWFPVEGWTGHVESDGQRLAEVTTPVLKLLEAHTRAALIGIADRMSIALFGLDIELRVPLGIDDALEAGVAVDEVVAAMQRLNMTAGDIATVLQQRLASIEVGLSVATNADIAATGLDAWPDAVAVHCVALGADAATWCRGCARANPEAFSELTWGNTILISTGTVRCDRCGHTTGTPAPPARPRDGTPASAPPDAAATPEGR